MFIVICDNLHPKIAHDLEILQRIFQDIDARETTRKNDEKQHLVV